MELFQSPNIEILGIAVAVAAIGAVSAYIYLSKKPKGPVEFAAVGVSIAVFNQVSRIAFFPLVSITTSFVAEEDATSKIRSIEEQETDNMEKALPKSSKMKESSTQAAYGLDERISTNVDVYGNGILLLETFTRKKPADAMLTGSSRLRQWVCDAFPDTVTKVVDDTLIMEIGHNRRNCCNDEKEKENPAAI